MKHIALAIKNTTALVSIARAVAVVFEPDGGINPNNYTAFSTICIDANNIEYAVYGTPCHDELAANVAIWKNDPAALLAAVTAALAARWPDIQPPLLADVEAFCADVRISSEYGITAGIAQLELTLQTQGGEI